LTILPESMDDYINEISEKVTHYKKNETLLTDFQREAKNVSDTMKNSQNNTQRGSNLRVTDLVNPIHAYYDIKNQKIENPIELDKKYNYGKFIEEKVRIILSSEPGYAGSQGYVDGSKVGMPDVKGKIDFRLDDTIIEFKTSEYDIPDVRQLINKNPQDLEQLLLYVLFTGRTKMDHILLYLTERYPNLVPRQFKVKIRDEEKLLSYFKARYENLKKAIEDNNPDGLGICRYYEGMCKFKVKQICKCDAESNINVGEMQESILLCPVSENIGDKIANENLFRKYDKSMALWDIFTPRKWVLKASNPYDYQEWDETGKDRYYLKKEIEHRFVDKGLLKYGNLSKDTPQVKDQLFYEPGTEKEQEKYPFLVRVRDRVLTGKPTNVYLALLGLQCSLSNTNKGYIFVFASENNVGILYEISFEKLRNVRSKALKIIDNAIKSINKKIVEQPRPICPTFIFKEKPCLTNCICFDEAKS